MTVDTNNAASATSRRAAQLLFIAAFTLAAAGYFVGTRAVPATPPVARPARTPDAGVPDALSYSEMREARARARLAARTDLSRLSSGRALPAATSPPNPADKRDSLAARAERRAFNGAPPVIPHPIDQRSPASCLACHADGLVVGDRVAPKVPHERFESCTQCHVESRSAPFEPELLAENSFDGIAAPLEGSRAYAGAPPVLPHTTWMRDDCRSCHGPLGLPGMRCSHPERLSCRQCHASSAVLDRVPFVNEADSVLAPNAAGNDP